MLVAALFLNFAVLIRLLSAEEQMIIPAANSRNYLGPLPQAPDVDTIGRCSWNLLHTITMAYPKEPSPQQQKVMQDFFYTLSQVYPCSKCATHFQEKLRRMPPRTESREVLVLWLCQIHNQVNFDLGKPIFPCRRVFERWDVPA